jgi:glutamyl/glutaminyl-tRNA synthetase
MIAWQRAREAGGALVMRMEDLDGDRSRREYVDAALNDLRWLGLDWDEGPDIGGPFGPYRQSARLDVYRAAWQKLYEGGFLYPCRCSRKDLAAALSAPHEGSARANDPDDEPLYPGTCRPSGTGEGIFELSAGAANPSQMNWRFRVPDGEAIEFQDVNLGAQRFIAGEDFGDFLVWRRDGVPSYQLACVVDDAAMLISEVVRGADLLKSTARQILLNRALSYADPAWFHCELVLDEKGVRLAKRHDALSLRALREQGLSPTDLLAGKMPG